MIFKIIHLIYNMISWCNECWNWFFPKYIVLECQNEGKKDHVERYEGKLMRGILFTNAWDICSCKIYSSIAELLLKGYLGNSKVHYCTLNWIHLIIDSGLSFIVVDIIIHSSNVEIIKNIFFFF